MRKIAWVFGLSLVIMVSVLYWLYQDIQQELRRPLKISKAELLLITPGLSLAAIARELQARAWLEQADYLILHGRHSGVAGSIKAGEYAITPGMTALELLDMLVAGKVVEHALTLVEGWTFDDILHAIQSTPRLQHTVKSSEPAAIMQAIGKPGQAAEGRFYPDTYHFPTGMRDVDFLSRAYDKLVLVLAEEWQGRAADLPYATAYEALIMASLIEKETALPEERARIAGVFVRRLQHGMRLQTDPTVIYVLGKRFDGNLTRQDLKVDSPYNTYRYRGLPPTPIAAAGREAIHAALHPAPGDALYFVARGDGSHHFSATLKEHNAAVLKYQLSRRSP